MSSQTRRISQSCHFEQECWATGCWAGVLGNGRCGRHCSASGWRACAHRKSATGGWQRALSSLFELAELKNSDDTPRRVHPHLFRHTFATDLLAKGVSLQNVATLLGHSTTRTTEKHYSHWIQERADRLEAAVRQAWPSDALPAPVTAHRPARRTKVRARARAAARA
jgi:hypothetical protein